MGTCPFAARNAAFRVFFRRFAYRKPVDFPRRLCYNSANQRSKRWESTGMENRFMKRIQTLETRNLCESAKRGGCGECQTSCQSACKTSCGVANQKCESQTEKR